MSGLVVERAARADAARIAELHASRITEGFLPVLGARFLTRLYRRVIASDDAFAVVARDADTGVVIGFCATALDVGALYKRFVVRDGLVAGIVAAPRIAKHLRRVLETLRYGSAGADVELPAAEVLAVAVDPGFAGQGVGRRLVAASQESLVARGVDAAKVVAGADNVAAAALYRSCGFAVAARIQVHDGIDSAVLVWRHDAIDLVRAEAEEPAAQPSPLESRALNTGPGDIDPGEAAPS